jgi:hypothetical protein
VENNKMRRSERSPDTATGATKLQLEYDIWQ